MHDMQCCTLYVRRKLNLLSIDLDSPVSPCPSDDYIPPPRLPTSTSESHSIGTCGSLNTRLAGLLVDAQYDFRSPDATAHAPSAV